LSIQRKELHIRVRSSKPIKVTSATFLGKKAFTHYELIDVCTFIMLKTL